MSNRGANSQPSPPSVRFLGNDRLATNAGGRRRLAGVGALNVFDGLAFQLMVARAASPDPSCPCTCP